MSLRNLTFTAAARTDFRSIQRYTRRMWGEARRDQYAGVLLAAMERLVKFPELGIVLPQVHSGVRRLVVDEHVVFYTVDGETILVLRILHKRQDDVVLTDM